MEKGELIQVLDDWDKKRQREKEKSPFYIQPKSHFLDHIDHANFRKWFGGIKKTFWTGLVLGLVGFGLIIIGLGLLVIVKTREAMLG